MICPVCQRACGTVYHYESGQMTTTYACPPCQWRSASEPTTPAQLATFERQSIAHAKDAAKGRETRKVQRTTARNSEFLKSVARE